MGSDMLSDVSPASRHWGIRVRVARMWDFCGTRDNQAPIHVDLVLVDEKGNSMYAEIPGAEAAKFKKLVKEHNVYALRKFLVAPNKQAYRPFPAKYMIRNVEIKLVLWGERAEEFDAQLVYDAGQDSAVVGVFVGMLMKCYNNEETLSGGSPCRWYLNEDLPEIDSFFESMGDDFVKTKWISTGSENFTTGHSRANLPMKSVSELRNMDPWEMEGTDFLCTVTIARVVPDQAWWFWSCSKCHRSATVYGTDYRCSGGCASPIAYPKYRLCLVGTDGTGTAEFVFFNRVAQQLVGKSVVPQLKSSGVPRDIAAIVLQKYTLAVSVTEKSLTRRNISFQVNGIEAFLGKQTCLPNDNWAAPAMPMGSGNSQPVVEASSASASKVDDVPQLPILPAGSSRRAAISRVPLGSTKRKETDAAVSVTEEKEPAGGAPRPEGSVGIVPQDLNSVPAALTELSAEAVTPVGSTEFQAMVPDIPPGYPSISPVNAADDGSVILPAAPAKKNNAAKKMKTKP